MRAPVLSRAAAPAVFSLLFACASAPIQRLPSNPPAAEGSIAAPPASVPAEPVPPTAADLHEAAAARDAIVPPPAARTYGPLQWLPTVENGLSVAAELDRPLVLWIMSADPLSCDCPGELAGSRGHLGHPAVAPLLREFVGATDLVWRMQTSEAPAARLFRRSLGERPRAGLYAIAPSGTPLAAAHTLAVNDLEEALGAALERWSAMPRPERIPAPAAGVPRFVTERPDGGLVLTAWGRDLIDEGGRPVARSPAFRRDQVWIERGDALRLVPAPLEVGARAEAPAVARELARHALLDDVRGAVAAFEDEQVERALLSSRVEAIGADGTAALVLWGETRAVAPGVSGPRGVETRLIGRATFDPTRGRFSSFELVARGTRFGRSETNARRDDEAPTSIGFVIESTADDALRRSAPSRRVFDRLAIGDR